MGNSHLSLALATLAPLAVPCTARAQEVTVLTEDLCASCTIELTPDVVHGTDGRFFAPGWLAAYDDQDIVPKYRMHRVRLTGLPQHQAATGNYPAPVSGGRNSYITTRSVPSSSEWTPSR